MRLWSRITTFLTGRRSFATLLLIGLVIGIAWSLSMLPLSFVAGTGKFWTFPPGIFGGDGEDIATTEAGYLALVKAPWTLPVLFTPLLNAPQGINIFWLDALPWVSLAGRLLHSATGVPVNLIGLFLLACLALPAVAMTTLLAAAGHREPIAALSGSLIAVATPYLLFRWGHIALSAQFLIVLALSLYLVHRRRPRDLRLAAVWSLFLPFVLLTNVYLLAMCGACWGAALMQRRVDGRISTEWAAVEVLCVAGGMLMVMEPTGILSSDLGSAASWGFGWWSMNLLSPIVPQMSGLIPPLARFRIGMPGQYEGFAWVGGGVLFLGVLTARAWLRWLRARARAHLVLLAVFGLFFLFALSNRIYAGTFLLVDINLPAPLVGLLGMFRSSGRFFWPIGYAFAAGSIVLTLRNFRPAVSTALLAVAALLQVIDVEPIRSAIAAATLEAAAPDLDRAKAAALVQRAHEVKVFPSYDCALQTWFFGHQSQPEGPEGKAPLLNLEFQLLAVRNDRPINSVYAARLHKDCQVERAEMHEPRRRGTLYIYLLDLPPWQMSELPLADGCASARGFRYCLLPEDQQDTAEQ